MNQAQQAPRDQGDRSPKKQRHLRTRGAALRCGNEGRSDVQQHEQRSDAVQDHPWATTRHAHTWTVSRSWVGGLVELTEPPRRLVTGGIEIRTRNSGYSCTR